jgi:hypothetical protein
MSHPDTPEVRSHTKKPDGGAPSCAHPKCRNKVTPDDYCFGCKAYTCEEHSSNPDVRFGPHPASEHWQEDD